MDNVQKYNICKNLFGGTEEDHNKSESAGVSAELRSEHLRNTRLEYYYL
jgi:hypothetical protein